MIPILMMVVVLGGSVVGVMSILRNEKKKNAKKKKIAAAPAKQKNVQSYVKLHKKLWDNFLVRQRYRALVERLGEMGIYTKQELYAQAVKFFLKTTLVSTAVAIIGILCFQDFVASIIVIGFSYLMQNVLVNKQIDKVHFALIKQLSVALSSVREMYTKYGTIPDAITECKKGKLIQSAFERIYVILTSNDGAEKLEEFYATTPVRLLQTFANVCYVLNDSGDSSTESGNSAFKQGISLLKKEVDMEIRKLTKQNIAFGFLEYLPIIPMFVVGIVQSFFMNSIPGTSIMYHGVVGYISRTLIALTALAGYYIISIINCPSAVRENDRMSFVDRLLRIKPVKSFIDKLTPKKTRTKMKYDKLLKGALSAKDITYIYTTKVIVATVTCVFMTIIFTFVMQFAREFVYNNTASLSMVQGTPLTESQKEKIVEMDKIYMSNEVKPSEEEATELVYGMLSDMYELDRLEQVDRLSLKWDTYHGLVWHWWYVLVIFAVTFISWQTPELMIRLRKYLVKTETEEDILQMQTMLSILMYTSCDTLEAIYWLIKTSTIHKDILLYCYHEYPSNPELSIERMKGKVNYPEFQNMCDKLISTINYVSLYDAFCDLITEREHVMQIREMTQEASIKKKRQIASPLALASLFTLCVGHILVPIGYLGIREFLKAFEQMGYMQ